MDSPSSESVSSLTSLLGRANSGEPAAADAVFKRTYTELKAIAQKHISGFPLQPDLNATAVVNAACERLLTADKLHAENRRHFFFLLDRAIHDVLVESTRQSLAAKRGGGWSRVGMIEIAADGHTRSAAASAVQQALIELQAVDSDAAHVVRLRYFCGLSMEQAAATMDCTLATVRSHWAYGKAWLHERLSRETLA